MVIATVLTATVTEIEGRRFLLTISGYGSPFTKEASFGAISAARVWAEEYAKSINPSFTVKVIVKFLEA